MPKYFAPPQEWIHLRDYTGVITSQEKQILENNWNAYKLENYYIHRWNTTATTLQQFDWNIYTKNYERSKPSLQTYILKTMTGWLPVFYNLNKMEHKQQHCHLCHQSETIPHLFQCRYRKTWKNQFLTQLDTHLRSTKTEASFATQLHHHMHQLLYEPHDFDHFKHFTVFAGFLPTDWKQQAISPSSSSTNTADLQHRWALQFSAWITSQGHELWCLRNQQIHDKDNTMTQSERLLNNKITQLYELKNAIGYHDQDIFSQPIDEKLSLSEKQKMRWIEQTTKTMKVSMADYENKQTTGQKDIRHFFSSKTPKQNV